MRNAVKRSLGSPVQIMDQKTGAPSGADVDQKRTARKRQGAGVNIGTTKSPKRNQPTGVRKDQVVHVPPRAGVDQNAYARKSQNKNVNTGTTTRTLYQLCESIKQSYREHIGLERARISVSNRLGADERQQAWNRCKLLGTLPDQGFPEVEEIDKAHIRRVRWRLHSVLAPLVAFDKEVDKELTHFVKHLPVAGIIDTIPGFSFMSLGAIVGSAGNLSNYQTYQQLWKRMGVGLHDGRIQKKRKGVSGEEALAIGYNEERRAVMRVISLSLTKCQGYYREIYLSRKQYENERATAAGLTILPSAKITKKLQDTSMSLKHVDNRALRYTEKRLLRKLWQAWRATAVADIIVTDPPAPKLMGRIM